MSQQNIATIRRFWAGFNAHDLNVWDELCTDDFINYDPGLPTPEADLKTIKQSINAMQTAFPDMSASENDLLADGDKVAVHMTLTGTHKGEFMGVPASGKAVEFSGVWLAHFKSGKIKKQWVYFNAMGLLMQIGAIPAPG